MTYGTEAIKAERHRQINKEGWTPGHDEGHTDGELVHAAVAYAVNDALWWPWRDGFKPSLDGVRNLEKAGALIAAEIDRLLGKADELLGGDS